MSHWFKICMHIHSYNSRHVERDKEINIDTNKIFSKFPASEWKVIVALQINHAYKMK